MIDDYTFTVYLEDYICKNWVSVFDNEQIGIYETFMKGIKDNNVKLENPDVTLYMIIELVGSTIFNSIVKDIPLSIDEYKPYLYKTIRLMLKENK